MRLAGGTINERRLIDRGVESYGFSIDLMNSRGASETAQAVRFSVPLYHCIPSFMLVFIGDFNNWEHLR